MVVIVIIVLGIIINLFVFKNILSRKLMIPNIRVQLIIIKIDNPTELSRYKWCSG